MSRRKSRPTHLVEHESWEASSHPADEPGGGETHEDFDPEFVAQVAEVLNLDAFDPAGRSDILAFVRGRFNPMSSGPARAGPPLTTNRGLAGRFTGAAQG